MWPADGGLAELDIGQLDGRPAVVVSIGSLRLVDTPRRDGVDQAHCRVLAEVDGPLPPIVVHGGTMRVIDGMHRVRAAVLRGDDTIAARVVGGTADDAFVLAVRLNIAHGLPLTRADRAAAAARIVQSHPQWSNRMIAAVAGLSAGTVADIRKRSTAQTGQSVRRIGKDGRMRPVSGVAGRLKVRELLAQQPQAPVRAIARQARVSPSTVHDVRKRLHAGQDPVPGRQHQPDPRPAGAHDSADAVAADTVAILMKDPGLRFSDAGRRLIRWLDGCQRGAMVYAEIAESVPPHCLDVIAKMAREFARAWDAFASKLEERKLKQCS